MKMRAILRYRRIPDLWVRRDIAVSREIADIRPAVIPVLQSRNGQYLVDSTPIALEVELDGRSYREGTFRYHVKCFSAPIHRGPAA